MNRQIVKDRYFDEYMHEISHTIIEISLPTHQTHEAFLMELRGCFPHSFKKESSLFDFLAFRVYNEPNVFFRIFLSIPVSEMPDDDQCIYADLLRVKDDFESRNSIKYAPALELFEGDPTGYQIVHLEDFHRFDDLHWKVRELIGFAYSDVTNMDAMEEEMEDINAHPKSVKILFVGIPKTEKNNLTLLSVIFTVQKVLYWARRIEFVDASPR